MSREPAREQYDAIVDLEPKKKGEIPAYAYALVKLTYEINSGRTVLSKPEPLLFDVYRDTTLTPRFPTGSDFWVSKTATDVVIQGSAFTPNGHPLPSLQVVARMGRLAKRIAVFGRREIGTTADGGIRIGKPEPFADMPLIYGNAYGGLDPRVPIPEPQREKYMTMAKLGMVFDHPGGYPRNLIGKGYFVYPEPLKGAEMPNLEDPDDLLSPERLPVRSPELWYKQPLPWCFDWVKRLMFPRELYAGYDAWFPCNDDSLLPEVRRHFIPPRLAQIVKERKTYHPDYFQEASLGMSIREPLAGQPISVTGMNPEESVVSFNMPPDPLVEIEVEGRKTPVKPLLTNLVIRPAERKLCAVYCAKTSDLPRAFIPEVHKVIPLSVQVNRDAPLKYEAPPTVRDRLAAAASAAPVAKA
jgi:hypothetical protein